MDEQTVYLVNVFTFDAANRLVNTYVFTRLEAADRAAIEIENQNSKLTADVTEQRVFTSYTEWNLS